MSFMPISGDGKEALAVTQILKIAFAHRTNANGTTDSICLKCFLTVASGKTGDDLGESEKTHNCGGFDLAYSLHPESFNDQAGP
jgi:hypothetical protein